MRTEDCKATTHIIIFYTPNKIDTKQDRHHLAFKTFPVNHSLMNIYRKSYIVNHVP